MLIIYLFIYFYLDIYLYLHNPTPQDSSRAVPPWPASSSHWSLASLSAPPNRHSHLPKAAFLSLHIPSVLMAKRRGKTPRRGSRSRGKQHKWNPVWGWRWCQQLPPPWEDETQTQLSAAAHGRDWIPSLLWQCWWLSEFCTITPSPHLHLSPCSGPSFGGCHTGTGMPSTPSPHQRHVWGTAEVTKVCPQQVAPVGVCSSNSGSARAWGWGEQLGWGG